MMKMLGPVIECIFYCLLHMESLVECKMYPKSTPDPEGPGSILREAAQDPT